MPNDLSASSSAPITPPAPVQASPIMTPDALAAAERELAAAKSAIDHPATQLKKLKRTASYHRVRYLAARAGVPAWLAALLAGSVVAIIASFFLIFVLGGGIVLISLALLLAYAVIGGGIFWLFRSDAGEDETNRLQHRTAQLAYAEERCRMAADALREQRNAVTRAEQRVVSIMGTLQSADNKRRMREVQLLSVDSGRLYPDEFERYVADIFAHLGYSIEVTGQSGDQGVDVLACKGGMRLAIQAKRYLGSVGNAAVQEVFAGMAHHRCGRCLVVTNSDFTAGAVALAQSTNCLLIGSDKIKQLIRGEIPL